ncbi:MAG: glycosyltransferase family 2 protein [Flavobacteriaceae bacterium]
MNPGKISVLMPFKNTAVFLEECINSVLAQTYGNWELLAVDDHSTDRSKSIVLDYSTRDQRIKVLSNKNHGIISALKTAYANASGIYITRMDSDDIMYPSKLEYLINSLSSAGPGHLAVGQVKYFSSTGISDGYARYEKWINQLIAKGSNYDEIYKECVVPSPCWMAYKVDLEKSGAFESDRYPEDYDLTFRFYKNQLKCIPCSQVLHKWRDYPSRTSRTSVHYAQNYFLDIKVHYFLELDHDPSRPLAVWGAGTKGKTVARLLQKRDLDFYWLCDNPKKIGKKIYDCELLPYQALESLQAPQSIVSVANSEAQEAIRSYLENLGLRQATDYFFFC